jgi:hypothetical protein
MSLKEGGCQQVASSYFNLVSIFKKKLCLLLIFLVGIHSNLNRF